MELTHEEIERYIDQISSGVKIVDIDDKTILLKSVDVFTTMKAGRIYNQEYKKSIDDGLLSIDDMKKVINDRNLINEKERKELSSLKSKLEAQYVLLSKTTKVKANQDRIKNIIEGLKEKIFKIESKERSKLSMTAETMAEESKILFLCWASCYNFGFDDLYWSTYTDFLNEVDLVFRQKIVSEFVMFYSGVSTSEIRCIARSNLWRIRYVTSLKTSDPLFGIPTSQYTNDMLNLAYWSHFYQNIYEMMPEDQPPDYIIEDDEALDAYLKDYYDERSKDVVARRDKKRRGKLSAFDHQEVIVTRSSELYEDIEYDKPKESAAIKDRNSIQKKIRRNTHRR